MEKTGQQKLTSKDTHATAQKRAKNALAALGALAATLLPAPADARAREGTEMREIEKPPIASSNSAFSDFSRGRGRTACFPGGTAVVALGNPDSNLTNFTMFYETKEERIPPFVFNGPLETGNVLFILPGRERTVVITEKNIIVTIGYEAALRGRQNLDMEERELRGNTYYYDLPEDVRGAENLPDGRTVPRLQSATIVENPGGRRSTVFFISRNGHLRATRVESMSEPYANVNMEINEDACLLNAGTVAILAEPGRNAILALTADFETDTIIREVLLLPEIPQGNPEIHITGGDIILSFDNMQVMVLVGEPGNPHSISIVAIE
jgi:hypothetical protein